ncbi:anticodon-binding aminoacyl-tRNA synthetase, class 1a [Tanacetum coccineum]
MVEACDVVDGCLEKVGGFGHVQGDDLDRFQSSNTKVVSLVNLLDEAKTRCKVLLAGQAGMADEWTSEELEHAAEALGYGAVKSSSKDIKELTTEDLILMNDDERELGLHLLRFTEVLGEACTILAPHILCEYLLNYARSLMVYALPCGRLLGLVRRRANYCCVRQLQWL